MMKQRRPVLHAYVIEQIPHPMFGPAPFVLVKFEGDGAYWNMDRRRIKRETAKAMKAWRKSKR